MQDQDAPGRRVVQIRPGQLDLLQLAQNLVPEVLNGLVIAGFGRVRSELLVQLLPSEAERSTEGEGAVGQPEVEIEAQRTTLESREGVHVERHRMVVKGGVNLDHFGGAKVDQLVKG